MSHGGGEGGGGSERWLISYADFITLLMVLFVILYSMGQIDIKRYKQLADGLRVAFTGGPEQVVDPMIDQAGGSKDKNPSPIVIPGIPSSAVNPVEVAGRLTDLLAGSGQSGSVSVQNNIEGILISMSEKLLFQPGSADLQPEAYPVLDAIVEMLSPLENDLRVVGHTDSSAPSRRFESNWELSVLRAVTIVNYLVEAGIAPERITASGRSEYSPIFPNDSPEHRTLNGRADIIVVYKVETEVIDLNWNTDAGSEPDNSSPADPGE